VGGGGKPCLLSFESKIGLHKNVVPTRGRGGKRKGGGKKDDFLLYQPSTRTVPEFLNESKGKEGKEEKRGFFARPPEPKGGEKGGGGGKSMSFNSFFRPSTSVTGRRGRGKKKRSAPGTLNILPRGEGRKERGKKKKKGDPVSQPGFMNFCLGQREKKRGGREKKKRGRKKGEIHL